MASLKEVEQVADDLEKLVDELRSELQDSPDFERLTEIADQISEHADGAAQAFSSVNEALTARISELTGDGNGKSKSGSTRGSAQKTKSSTS